MNTKICPVCKTPIPANAPGGLCPACILRDADEPAPAGRAAPALAEIAAAFPQLEIEKLIGQGGMGFVYKARQPALDRTVALKILSPELSRDPAFAERFAREARVLGKLSHPNIVTIFEHGQTTLPLTSGSQLSPRGPSADLSRTRVSTKNSQPFFYLLMEYVDGVNLRQAMRAGRFTPTQALAVVPGLCDALQAAHAQGVWHRDIKPENILLDARGGVKIADFGIARIVGDPGRDFTLTATGAALGSAAYMAPEQHESPHDVDHRADIYSLGVVIYEMLTGELPLGRFPAPSQRAAVNARIDEIVFRTLEKERELRQQSAEEVKTDVTRAAASPQGTQPGRSPATLTVMSIALLVAGLVMPGAAVLFTGGSDQGLLLTLGIVVLATGYVFAWFVFWMMRRERIEKTWRGWLRLAVWTPLLAVLAVPAYLVMEERVLANSHRAEDAMREKEQARQQIEAMKRDAKRAAEPAQLKADLARLEMELAQRPGELKATSGDPAMNTPKAAPANSVPTVFLSGQVNRAGVIAIPEGRPITVSMAVTLAGGATRIANLSKVQLHRPDANGATQTSIVNVKKALEGKATPEEDPVVLPGDRINVPESSF